MSPHYRHTQVGWIILGVAAAILAFVWSRLPPEAAAAALFPLLLDHRPHRARLQRPDRRGGCRGDPPALRDRPGSQADSARRSEGLAGRPQPLVHRVGDPPGAGLRALERVGTGRGGARSRQRPALPRRDGRAGRARGGPRAREGRGPGVAAAAPRRAARGLAPRVRLEAARRGARPDPGGGGRALLVPGAAPARHRAAGRPGGREPFLREGVPGFRRHRHLAGADPPPRPPEDQRLCRRAARCGATSGSRGWETGASTSRRASRRTSWCVCARASSSSTSASRRGRGRSTTRWPERGPTAWLRPRRSVSPPAPRASRS